MRAVFWILKLCRKCAMHEHYSKCVQRLKCLKDLGLEVAMLSVMICLESETRRVACNVVGELLERWDVAQARKRVNP